MKRSALSTALLYAAGGFVVTAAIQFTPPLQADGEAKAFTLTTTASTPTFDAALVTDPTSGVRQLEITSSVGQPTSVEWSVRVMSAGVVSPMQRTLPIPKEVYKKSMTTDLAARQKLTLPLEIPAAQDKESRTVFIDIGGKSLVLAGQVTPSISLLK